MKTKKINCGSIWGSSPWIIMYNGNIIFLACRCRLHQRLCETMDWQATAVWHLRPTSGGAPKRGPHILQELHADAARDVRWAASQSESQDHQKIHMVQGAPGAWPEARTDFASPCLWEQVFSHEVRMEGPPQHPVTHRQRGLPSHHRWVHARSDDLTHHSWGMAYHIWQVPPEVELPPYHVVH